jgi:outer membrane lipoprotein-sorting protein
MYWTVLHFLNNQPSRLVPHEVFTMRFSALALATIVLGLSSVRADDAADAKAIVEKAIKAKGDKEDKPVVETWKGKGTFTGGGFKMDFKSEAAFQGPDKYRFKVNGDFNGMEVEFFVVVNGEKAWQSGFGTSEEITDEKLEHTKSEVYQLHVMSLRPLLKDKDFKLTTAGEKAVGDKAAKVVKVTREKRPTVTLYFDKDSGLLVKCDMMVKDEFQGWKEVLSESYFEDYKDIGGRKLFSKMRVVRDGKTMIESTLSDQKTPEKLDAKLFEKP